MKFCTTELKSSSVTYIEMLSETKNLLLNVVQLVKADIKLQDYLPAEMIPEEIPA